MIKIFDFFPKRDFYGFFAVIGLLALISSCAANKNTVYFSNQQDAILEANNLPSKNVIQANDILSIAVTSLNPAATEVFNKPNNAYVSTSSVTGANLQSPGYLVGEDGKIQFPVLGAMKISGMTTAQLREKITADLLSKKLLVDPIVIVRQLNFRVSVLGEVGHPSVVNVPNEKISLLEALGLAGDITIYGRKENVMVIREEDGVKKIKRLNLNSSEIFTSDYYYLKSNDIVYVEANKAKAASSTRSSTLIPILLSALSFGAIIIDRIVR
ncbi:polysaccharide biosynthesis/export family protein [Pedobacter sp. MC2016-05]|uniref:polysaccharide biosynthesis/export family protein n=1 Tax=Pedobacter sp. MC2016-05 TaxID=2994474 RepID=UPI0022465D40|nr:polysaccharide biosynthesis/export family protein [Pedobacter sp. MC2016-05]MCX2473257.1 polysaccharide biosynthesis/export family protein [Pedobacter sp. MC2016-05]